MKYTQYNGRYATIGGKYVILGGGSAPISFVNATGGTVTTDGDYKIHTFLTSGIFTVISGGDVSVLVVGGGSGSNGARYGLVGGGGGGQVIEKTVNVGVGDIDVSIGAGGAGGARVNPGDWGKAGGKSYFGNYVDASGGQTGPVNSYMCGLASGSGYVGGQQSPANVNSGGGGGAGEAGTDGIYEGLISTGGNGGDGVFSQITGQYYGGGGGGTGQSSTSPRGEGGLGGGGWSSNSGAPASAIPNTGGGGARTTGGYGAGEAGAAGIVVIKYKYK